jgi:hypothetical protein
MTELEAIKELIRLIDEAIRRDQEKARETQA